VTREKTEEIKNEEIKKPSTCERKKSEEKTLDATRGKNRRKNPDGVTKGCSVAVATYRACVVCCSWEPG
jgi:hypothetical protein